jgi:hypothetical protein
VAGNTVIFDREAVPIEEHFVPLDFGGFGYEFEKAYTKDRISDSTEHHRIISYKFSNTKIVVRHETDGFVDANLRISPAVNPRSQENDTVSNKPGSTSLPLTKQPEGIVRVGSKLRIRMEGFVVPNKSTLEIKTRAAARPIDFTEVATQLWVSQTPNLVRAYHTMGLFREPTVEDVSGEIRGWELGNQGDLRRFAALIKEILRISREIGGRMVLKYNQVSGDVVIQKFEGKKMLPDDVYRLWN